MSGAFVHLHNHSDYSLLDGAMKTRAMVAKAAADGQPALALTDHGNLFGTVEFYLECRKKNLKPILGMEAYVTRDRHDRSGKDAARNHHTVLLARNARGWQNLIRLATAGYLEGFYYKPRVDKELLAAHSEGIVALSACLGGEPNSLLRRGDVAGATRAAGEYKEIFGDGNYFLEIQDHGLPEEAEVRRLVPDVARAVGVPVVATNDCHFLERDHFEAHDILLAIQTGKTLHDPGRWRSATPEVYLKSTAEMLALFQDWPQAVQNTLRIAEMIELELDLGKLLLPAFPLPAGFASPEDYVEHLAREGLRRRYPEITAELEERLAYELTVIRQTGYAGYFLIVWDFIDAARRMNIPVGPGRGSAAGSLVCYAMGITDIDPIRHQLLFERFLNPERVSMPDIDVDFCFEKRPQIIRYVEEKYGRENVSQIITFGTMAARAVIKDVARVLDLGFVDADRISKLVPEELGITLERAIKEAPGLKEVERESEVHAKLLRNALVLEGLNRNPGIHAAGVLITPTPLINHVPLYQSTKGDITTQFDMRMAEELGLLKMDFLGLRTLTVIDHALALVAETTGRRLTPAEIPTDDSVTFQLLQEGRTVGVFQLESAGMQKLVRSLKPTSYGDITAINALFRPGPLGAGMHEVFVERKHGRQKITYRHPALEPILRDTYGVILYQEQVMQIASALGGFSMGQADTLRKAMGKKKADIMQKMKADFLAGAAGRGIDEKVARDVFEEMEFFAQYGFNKSHSAAYALLSLQTAWLKAHHPAEFMAATMTSEMRKSERITQLIDECKVMGLRIQPPDINRPRAEFSVANGEIVFGLGAVRGVGSTAIEAVRAVGRPLTDLFDLCGHVDLQKVNRKVLEGLIHAGALDRLPGDRATLVANLDRAIAWGQKAAREREGGQESLFGSAAQVAELKPPLLAAEPFDPLVQLSLEREAVGFYLCGHPFQEYGELVEALPVTTVRDAATRGEGTRVDLVGVITSHTKARDKHKRVYARAHFEDRTAMISVVVYARLYEETRDLVESDAVQVISGRVQVRSDGEREIVVERLTHIDAVLATWTREAMLKMNLDAMGAAGLACLERILDEHRGNVPLLVDTSRNGRNWLLRSSGRSLALSLASLRALRTIPGLEAVRLRVAIPPLPRTVT